MWENYDQSFTTLKLFLNAISNVTMHSLSIITIFCVITTENNVLPVS